jgi:excisionase family DNA binding protein
MSEHVLPDHEYLTVKELAALLRLKERKVYDLAASGAVPCSRATGKLLFPAAEIRAWIAAAQSGGAGPAPGVRPPILLGSHDPLLDWAVRESRCGLAMRIDGSLDGLARFARGEGVATGLHVHDAAQGRWNVDAAAEAASGANAVLVGFARRRRGFVTRPEGRLPAGFADLRGLRVVARQPESGADALFRARAVAEGLDPDALDWAETARTEDDAAAAVRRGAADVAFGLEAVAATHGLAFASLVDEEFALLVDRKAWFEPPLKTLMDFCASGRLAARAAELGGYDTRDLGTVLWNA